MNYGQLINDVLNERFWGAWLISGLVIVAVGYLWLAFRAVATSGWWRIGYVPPLALFFIPFGLRKAIGPVLLLVLGGLLIATPFAFTHVIEPNFPWLFRHPWEKIVDRELHVTLTGLKNFPYADLKKYEKVVVLQMANPDVTDQTLEHLQGLILLREIDLNDTQITDDGLALLAKLPSLEKIRIAKTKITDEGFQKHIAPRDWITNVDVRGTGVKSKTLRLWKAGKDGREYLN